MPETTGKKPFILERIPEDVPLTTLAELVIVADRTSNPEIRKAALAIVMRSLFPPMMAVMGNQT